MENSKDQLKKYGESLVKSHTGDLNTLEKLAEHDNPLIVQVGGSHYKGLKIQPTELAYGLNESPMFKDVAKYITRNKESWALDLEKAMHSVELQAYLHDQYNPYGMTVQCNNAKLVDIHYSESLLKAFAAQFKYSDLICKALFAMHTNRLTDTLVFIKLLKEAKQNESNL